jgi:hypothetical protein
MPSINNNQSEEETKSAIAHLSDTELIERIFTDIYFTRNAVYYLSSVYSENKSDKNIPTQLINEAQQKMSEVNQCLNELVERLKQA